MKPVNRRWFQRLADIAIPWGVGLFYVLVVLGDEYGSGVAPAIAGWLLAIGQGAGSPASGATAPSPGRPGLPDVDLLAPGLAWPALLAWVAAAFAAASELLRRRDLE